LANLTPNPGKTRQVKVPKLYNNFSHSSFNINSATLAEGKANRQKFDFAGKV